MPRADRDWRALRTGTGDWDPINARGDEYSPAALSAAASAQAAVNALNAFIARTVYVNKPTLETVNNSTTLQNDNDLFFTALATEVWDLEFILRYTSATAADFSWALSLPTGATFDGLSSSLQTAAAAGSDDRMDFVDETGANAGGLGVAVESPLWIKGIVTLGATAGTVQFQWAQRAADATNTSLQAASYMLARRIS